MRISCKKLPSEKYFTFGYLVAELEKYELKTFYDDKNFKMLFIGFSKYKAKKRFSEMIIKNEIKPLTKN